MPDPLQMQPAPRVPDEAEASVIRISIGGRRYEIRTSIEAREITAGPAEVVEIKGPPKRSA
jgi:hypothetical protein